MEEKIKVEVDSGKEFEAFIDREYKDGLNKTKTPLEIESPKISKMNLLKKMQVK